MRRVSVNTLTRPRSGNYSRQYVTVTVGANATVPRHGDGIRWGISPDGFDLAHLQVPRCMCISSFPASALLNH